MRDIKLDKCVTILPYQQTSGTSGRTVHHYRHKTGQMSDKVEEPSLEGLGKIITKQVAQRATIAHLSPMCQCQTSFKKNGSDQ